MLSAHTVMTGCRSRYCCAPKPMKNRSHSVRSRLRIVAVAAIPAGTPRDTYRVVIVISGSPTSKGIPTGIDFTAKTMAVVMRITLHETGVLNAKNTRYVVLRLKTHVTDRPSRDSTSGLGLRPNFFMES